MLGLSSGIIRRAARRIARGIAAGLVFILALAGCVGPLAPAEPTLVRPLSPVSRPVERSPVATATMLPAGSQPAATIIPIPMPPSPTAGRQSPGQTTRAGSLIGQLKLAGQAVNLALAGNELYVAAGASGVRLVDVSDPIRPTLTGHIDAVADDVAASREFLVVFSANTKPHLRVFELSEDRGPAGPSEIIPYVQTESAGYSTIDLYADRLILAGGAANTQIINLRARPLTVAATIEKRKAFVSVSSFAGLVFLSEETGATPPYAVTLYDLTDLRRPRKVGEVRPTNVGGGSALAPPANFPLTSAFDPPYLYVAGGGALTIYNLTNPAGPAQVGRVETGKDTMHVAVENGLAVVSNGDVVLMDVSNPAAPKAITTVTTPGQARASIIRNGIVYVADGDNGLVILQGR